MGTKDELPFYSDTFETDQVFIQAWYPVRGVLGSMAPEGYEPPTLFKVQMSRVNSERKWRIHTFTRETSSSSWASDVKETRRTKRGARKLALRLMEEHVDG